MIYFSQRLRNVHSSFAVYEQNGSTVKARVVFSNLVSTWPWCSIWPKTARWPPYGWVIWTLFLLIRHVIIRPRSWVFTWCLRLDDMHCGLTTCKHSGLRFLYCLFFSECSCIPIHADLSFLHRSDLPWCRIPMTRSWPKCCTSSATTSCSFNPAAPCPPTPPSPRSSAPPACTRCSATRQPTLRTALHLPRPPRTDRARRRNSPMAPRACAKRGAWPVPLRRARTTPARRAPPPSRRGPTGWERASRQPPPSDHRRRRHVPLTRRRWTRSRRTCGRGRRATKRQVSAHLFSKSFRPQKEHFLLFWFLIKCYFCRLPASCRPRTTHSGRDVSSSLSRHVPGEGSRLGNFAAPSSHGAVPFAVKRPALCPSSGVQQSRGRR